MINFYWKRCWRTLSICCLLMMADTTVQAAQTYSVDPTSTFLRTVNDGLATGPLIIDLASLSVPASFGETLRLERVGDYSLNSAPTETEADLRGLFSATAEVLDGSNQFRIPGAIDAGDNFVTKSVFSFGAPDSC